MYYMRSILISLAFSGCFVSSNASADPVSIIGTGVTIDVPSTLSRMKIGSFLIDDAGETIIAFTGGETKSNMETDPVWRALYRNPPEKIDTKHIKGNLYKRTRVSDGGKWDGWFLSVPRGGKTLMVSASYTGNSPRDFERIRNHLLTIRWDDENISSEKAMGIHLNTKGLMIVPHIFGGLTYNETGTLEQNGKHIIVAVQPVTALKGEKIFSAGCGAVLNPVFANESHHEPELREKSSIQLCEAWSTGHSQEMRYVSLVKLPNNVLLSVVASSPSNQFAGFLESVKEAVSNISLLR
jgi:hypothetical protein